MTGRTYARKTDTERRAERRARLLDAALEMFATAGFRSTPIELLCERASVSTRSFYEEFESKQDLLIALHDDLNGRVLTAVAEAVVGADERDVEGRARAGVSTYFSVMMGDRRWARIGLVETVGVSPETEAARQAAIGRFAGLIEAEARRFQELGLAPARDFRLSAIAAVGAIYGLANTWIHDEAWDDHVDDVVEEGTRVIVRAILDDGR